MKTIVFEDWVAESGEQVPRSRFILSHFDVKRLRAGKRAPGRARRKPRSSDSVEPATEAPADSTG